MSLCSGRFQNLLVEGHFGSTAEDKLNCASVSVLTQTFIQSVFSLVGSDFRAESKEGRAFLECHEPRSLNQNQELILEILVKSFLIGLKGIETRSKGLQIDFVEI